MGAAVPQAGACGSWVAWPEGLLSGEELILKVEDPLSAPRRARNSSASKGFTR